MDHLWLPLAIITLVVSGGHAFLSKMQAKYFQNSNIFVFYGYIFLLFVSAIILWIRKEFAMPSLLLLWYSFITVVFVVIYLKTRIASLKHLSSSTYFVGHRILTAIALLFFGIFMFHEHLSLFDYGGVFVGFLCLLLFLEPTKSEKKSGFGTGITLLLASVGATIVFNVINKYIAIGTINLFQYLFWQAVFGLIVTLFLNKGDWKELLIPPSQKALWFLCAVGTLFAFLGYGSNLAFRFGGDLVVVYKIVSYSAFVPILLSFFIFHEKITKRQLLGISLSIVSVVLFSL